MNLRNIVLGKRDARINYMMTNSIYKKPEMTNHKSVVAWGQGLGRLLQKDIKEMFGVDYGNCYISVYNCRIYQTLHL